MPKEVLIASEDIKPFFKELSLPGGFNGNEVNGKAYWEHFWNPSLSFDNLATITETYRRMQDFYDTLNSGRFFLCMAQRTNFSEVYSGTPPKWANDWIRSQYLDSAIHSYSASFDLYLQILWISFELFKANPKLPPKITEDALDVILSKCNINAIEEHENILGKQLIDALKSVHYSANTRIVRDLCKQVKHRKKISYKELSEDKHPIMVKSECYNSHNTLSVHTLDEVITYLKIFHKALTELAVLTRPIVVSQLT